MTELFFRYRCDVLWDQGRKIGENPVGYKCLREAEWEAPDGVLLCGQCKVAFEETPYRLSVGPNYGRKWQERIARRIFGVGGENYEHGKEHS